jgi:hypothetical protein
MRKSFQIIQSRPPLEPSIFENSFATRAPCNLILHTKTGPGYEQYEVSSLYVHCWLNMKPSKTRTRKFAAVFGADANLSQIWTKRRKF